MTFLVALPVSAATHVWSGAVDGSWSNALNWSSGGAPAVGEPSLSLVFPLNPVTYVTTNDVGALSLAGLTISDNGYTIGGAATISVDGPVNVDALEPSLVTVSSPLALSSTQLWNVTEPGTSLILSGVVSGGGGLTKSGSGVLSLGGTNTYGGLTTVQAGTVELTNEAGLGSTGQGTVVQSGAALRIGFPSDLPVSEPLTISGTGVGGTGALFEAPGYTTWLGGIILATADATVGATAGSILDIRGSLSGPGGLTKVGLGALQLYGTNSYSGLTTVSYGSLYSNCPSPGIPHDLLVHGGGASFFSGATPNQLSPSANVVVNPGGSCSFSDQTIATLTLNGGSVSGNPLRMTGPISVYPGPLPAYISGSLALPPTGNQVIDVGDSPTAYDLIISATISGAYGITKQGTGRLVFTGTNAYTGATTIQAGSVLVNGSSTYSNMIVNGGTLGGNGTVRNITANAGATVAPGASPGVLSAGPFATFDAGSTYAVEINGPAAGSGYDKLSVAGSVALAGNLFVTVGAAPPLGDELPIIEATGAVTGTFNGLADGATFCVSARIVQIHYKPASVVLTVTTDGTSPTVTPPADVTVTQSTCS